ncbi:MAG: type II toxin-antitoxin system Phd/YefM family antitoxin [Bacteroidetes bacterium]|nr:type II toxin-antitoxin system Phd/YefM family antitoxin [Bacteroidota bacterium]
MKTVQVAEFKARFSEIIDLVKMGEEICVVKGKNNEVAGYFSLKKNKRKADLMGIWKNNSDYLMSGDFNKTTEEEFSLGV